MKNKKAIKIKSKFYKNMNKNQTKNLKKLFFFKYENRKKNLVKLKNEEFVILRNSK